MVVAVVSRLELPVHNCQLPVIIDSESIRRKNGSQAIVVVRLGGQGKRICVTVCIIERRPCLVVVSGCAAVAVFD